MDTLYHFTVLHAENTQEFFITSFWTSLVTLLGTQTYTFQHFKDDLQHQQHTHNSYFNRMPRMADRFFQSSLGLRTQPKTTKLKGALHHVCWNGFYLAKKSGIQLTSKLNHLSQGGGFEFTSVPLLEARGRPGCCQGWKPQFLWQSVSVAPS